MKVLLIILMALCILTARTMCTTTYGFSGDVRDSATDLVYLRTRYYDVENGTYTRFVIDSTLQYFQVVEERDGGNNLTVSYTYGLDRLAASYSGSNATSVFYLPDRLGSVRQITDASGNITLTSNYGVFGNTMP